MLDDLFTECFVLKMTISSFRVSSDNSWVQSSCSAPQILVESSDLLLQEDDETDKSCFDLMSLGVPYLKLHIH